MELIKSPKSMAYARLGKPQSGKSSMLQQQKKAKRNSTGNIYQEIMEQYPAQTKSYIKNVVNNNKRQMDQSRQNDNISSRRKSYGQIIKEASSLQGQKNQKIRQQRDTLCKGRLAAESNFIQKQITPKNSAFSMNKWTSGSNNSANINPAYIITINSFKNEHDYTQQSFLSNLSNYLEELTEIPHNARPNFQNLQKLSETLKINSGQGDSFKLVAKIQQSHMKIKELKLKNYYQQKQLNKCIKKQLKMKQSLFEMLRQIKQITTQLSYQKKQRKKLEKILDSFQPRKQQHEKQRKTIGKSYLRFQQFQEDLNTQSQFDKGFDSSFQEYLNNALAEKKRNLNNKKHIQQSGAMNGVLDSEKIEKLFRSNNNSEESDY